ncbi:DUF2703 domain-containing protein [Halomonas organivorans]
MCSNKTQTIELEYLYIDNQTCARCQSSEKSFDEAISIIRPVLEATGRRLSIRRQHVDSLELSESVNLQSSPSIHINGRDIQPELAESHCTECSNLASGADIDCRVWKYQGKKSTTVPVGLIIEEVLKTIYSGEMPESHSANSSVPSNIRRFFEGYKNGGNKCDSSCSC